MKIVDEWVPMREADLRAKGYGGVVGAAGGGGEDEDEPGGRAHERWEGKEGEWCRAVVGVFKDTMYEYQLLNVRVVMERGSKLTPPHPCRDQTA